MLTLVVFYWATFGKQSSTGKFKDFKKNLFCFLATLFSLIYGYLRTENVRIVNTEKKSILSKVFVWLPKTFMDKGLFLDIKVF